MTATPGKKTPSGNDTPSNLLIGVCDLNGIYRGKRANINDLDTILKNGMRMPLSTIGADIWGTDVYANEQVFETGDSDGLCLPTERGAISHFWSHSPHIFIPATLFINDGQPFLADPRQALIHIANRFTERQQTPVAAMELEFYLVNNHLATPLGDAVEGRAVNQAALLSIDALDELDSLIDEVYQAAASCDIELDATISESGPGQYEINLKHQNDIVALADNVLVLKRIIRQVAKKHRYIASFMAKPFGDESGNGLHTHISLIDSNGHNLFDDGSETGSKEMAYAVNGLLSTMSDSTLLFAPHGNSYKRLRPMSHAPTSISWGYDNRTTSIRIPGGDAKARRIEHRVAGADANPYLVLAALLAGIDEGLNQQQLPPAAIIGNAYEVSEQSYSHIPSQWQDAIDVFSQSSFIKRYFDESLIRLLSACKRQEIETFAKHIGRFEYATYLESV